MVFPTMEIDEIAQRHVYRVKKKKTGKGLNTLEQINIKWTKGCEIIKMFSMLHF